MCEKQRLTPSDLNLSGSRDSVPPDTLKDLRTKVEQEHIRTALVKNNWNITKTASELGVSRPTLHDLINKYEIKKENIS